MSQNNTSGGGDIDMFSDLEYDEEANTHGSTDEPGVEHGTETLDVIIDKENNSACQPVADFILKICGEGKREPVLARLSNLGVETLSDLDVLDFKEAFLDVLTPVQIGKLQRDFKQISEIECKSKAGHEVIDFKKVFSHIQLNELECPSRLPHHEVIGFTKSVGDHLFLNISKVTFNLCKRIAKMMLTQFPSTLRCHEESVDVLSIATQLHCRVKYRHRLEKKKKVKSLAKENSLALHQFTKRQCHGLEATRDLPTEFPSGEDKESQESKRLQMVQMYTSGDVNWKTVKKLMEDTYVGQRLTINGLRMDSILKEWPYIGKFNILKAHFYKLMDLDTKAIESTWNVTCPNVVKFLTYEATKGKKGNAAEVSKSIRKVIKKFQANDDKSPEIEFVCVILGLAAKLDLNTSSLFRHFPDTASYDEIQASKNLPKDGKPCVAVLGDDLMQRPQCFVLVDNRIISPITVGPLKAILSVFMCYFVFKIAYPKSLYPLFNFLERDIFLIKIEGGSTRVEREKNAKGVWLGSPNALAPKYVTLKRQIQDYLDLWCV